MAASLPMPSPATLGALQAGLVIPAVPLALNSNRKFDENRQRALINYYLSSGAGGLAVAVHTTQFAIREPRYNLLYPVLESVSRAVQEWIALNNPSPVLVAGICGQTRQAVGEASAAAELGYHAGLLSFAGHDNSSDEQLIAHAVEVSHQIPLFGFYLQPAVGGRKLGASFWRRFVEIPNVVAIKVAPFNRYQTLDVMRAVAESGRATQISLYTGNDDSIVFDLLSKYRFVVDGHPEEIRFSGGLLGHWACWTSKAVELLRSCLALRDSEDSASLGELLVTSHKVTDMNAAIFDAANDYRGCIAGIHEVLCRQGLLAGSWCLDANERLSPGQSAEITRVCKSYPELIDDEFVLANRDRWLQ